MKTFKFSNTISCVLFPVIVYMFLFCGRLQAMNLTLNTEIKFEKSFTSGLNLPKDDSAVVKSEKSETKKISFGGVFISPTIGASFPIGSFANYSKSGLVYGFKAEIAFNKLYPFVFGFVYEYQNNPGNPEFTSTNVLNTYDTKITAIGGSVDFILNKYIKSNFTSPVITLEVKYASVKKDISPITNIPDIPGDKNLLTYSAGIGFTIYVLDLVSKYTFASEYSNLNFQARIHIPLIKF